MIQNWQIIVKSDRHFVVLLKTRRITVKFDSCLDLLNPGGRRQKMKTEHLMMCFHSKCQKAFVAPSDFSSVDFLWVVKVTKIRLNKTREAPCVTSGE